MNGQTKPEKMNTKAPLPGYKVQKLLERKCLRIYEGHKHTSRREPWKPEDNKPKFLISGIGGNVLF